MKNSLGESNIKTKRLKPGYYIDILDDLVVVYPDSSYEVYNIHEEDFVLGRVPLKERSGKFLVEFMGDL